MSTLVCFHAHPDDEAIATGGSMARAHAEGHRVVLVVATNGEHGEVPSDLADGETLADRRYDETARSAEVLGIDRVEFLGYSDSGMTGWAGNDHPRSFWQADVGEAANKLVAILNEESADVLTIYDWHGGYGHPDHIQVHRVGCRAEEIIRRDRPELRVLESTMNRDAMKRLVSAAKEMGIDEFGPDRDDGEAFDPEQPMDDGNPMGEPESKLTLAVDVAEFIEQKRSSIIEHASQVSDSSFFLQMPPEAFAMAFGTEYFIEHGASPGLEHGWLFDR